MKLVSGIYIFYCSVTKDVFIDASVIVRQKIKHHIRMLKAGAHSNKELQDLYNTYGETTIHFEIVDRSEEQYHAEKLREIQVELNAKKL
ncbi:hypothetical protein C8J95_11251 [Elizabethkingia sp. YR214]|uniref:hypothetical protein n=1 Tax=Elizabethkingia sp. YR214 TaxID=2135667 RepID=UPI000D305E75|nr:hypothetical protein [Elizabethkingia sp. YR214]PUB25884.1 hypothetical protein C8J95_11251 [Elizabethkingia sp. YR214]